MKQLFKISISGRDITSRVSGCHITYEMNRFYNVAIFNFDELPNGEEAVSIVFGDRHFDGFIYSAHRTSPGIYSVECRTSGAKLTEPYYSSGDYAIEDAMTSYDLCAQYGVINTCENLSFGGNYERKGTPLSALTTIANILGAEFWDDENAVRIEPNKPIQSAGTVISDSEIFNFVPMETDIYQKGIKVITIGSVSSPNEITSDIKCSANIDQCTGEVTAYVVPHDSFTGSENIDLHEVRIKMNKKATMPEGYSFLLDADIVSVESVKMNGIFVYDYSFVNDNIIFETPKRGLIAVEYHGYALKGYASIQNIDGQDYAQFNIYYGECEVFMAQQALSCGSSPDPLPIDPDSNPNPLPIDPDSNPNPLPINPGSNPNSNSNTSGLNTDILSECGGVWVNMPKTANYVVGFTFKTIGNDPYLTFYSDTEILTVDVESSSITLQQVESATLSEEEDGTIQHKLRFTPISLTEVRSNGENITSNASLSGDFVVFDKVYSGVVVSYEISAKEHTVKFQDQEGSVSMMVSGGGEGQCEYPLEGMDYDSTSSSICAEGASVAIDIVKELGVKSWDAANKGVWVTDPNGGATTIFCDAMGILHIDNIIFGTYILDTSSIQAGSQLKLKAGDSEAK